jgi:hypothetical protein
MSSPNVTTMPNRHLAGTGHLLVQRPLFTCHPCNVDRFLLPFLLLQLHGRKQMVPERSLHL